jgi:5'-nucleotidase
VPAIAVSLYLRSEIETNYARAAKYARRTIDQILGLGLKAGQVATVNIPALRADQEPAGLRFVRQCTRPWADTYERRQDPKGRDYFWNTSVFRLGETERDTDVAALRDGYITVTPLQFDLTDHSLLREWK